MLSIVSFIGISIMLLFFGYSAFVAVNIIKSYMFFVTKTNYRPPITPMMIFIIFYVIFCYISLEVVLYYGIMAIANE